MKLAITGGSTGIGAAVIAQAKELGHHVTAFDIVRPEQADDWIALDLSDAVSIDGALDQVDGSFDALVNNAGLPPRAGNQDLLLLVNWFGLRRFLDGFLSHLGEGAAIVNVASRAGARWRENLDEVRALMDCEATNVAAFTKSRGIDATRAYNLSKEAVIAMTHARTEEMIGRSLRMNSVSPSAVSSGILDDFLKAFGDIAARNMARVGRAGTPDEVASVILFLARLDSHWIKGQDILIDGGTSAMILADTLGL